MPIHGKKHEKYMGHELAMSLRSAYLSMHRVTNHCFSELGLSADSFALLTTLKEYGDMTQKELVRRIGSDANTVSAMLMRLEKRNLISRKRDKQDGRARIVTVTSDGKKMQKKMWKKSNALRVDMEKQFSSTEDIMQLIQHLKQIEELFQNSI